MRLVAVIERWDGSDTAAHAATLATALAARGHATTLLALGGAPPPGNAMRDVAVAARPRRLVPLLRAHDVVHLHLPLRQAGLVALACRRAGRPLLVSDHGAPRARQPGPLARASAALAVRLATWLAADSRDQAEHAPPLLDAARRVTCIVPPLDPADAPVVGPRPRDRGEAAVVLVPDAAARAWLEPRLRGLPGGVRVVDGRALPAPVDAVVLPPTAVAVPRALLHALGTGIPIVAVDVPGARDLVRRARHHALVAAGDERALLAAVAAAVVAPGGGRAPSAPPLDAIAGVDAYEAILLDLAARRTPPPRRTVPVRRPCADAPATLSAADTSMLDRLLANEMDFAYRRRARVLLDWLELADGGRVLDCGCGMGFYLLAMGRLRRLRLVGLDVDPGRTDWARREGVRAALVRGDFQHLPFAADAFDRVLLSETLEHVPDDRAALRELRRVLVPGGILAISVPHVRYPFWWDPLHRLWTALGGEPPRGGPVAGMWSNHERLYWPEDVVARLEEAGFAVERVEEATHYAFPFSHFLVYGVGKPLIERGLLPERLRRSADRMRGEDNPGAGWNPVNLARAVLRAVDRLNERPAVARRRTFVNVLVKARKPA